MPTPATAESSRRGARAPRTDGGGAGGGGGAQYSYWGSARRPPNAKPLPTIPTTPTTPTTPTASSGGGGGLGIGGASIPRSGQPVSYTDHANNIVTTTAAAAANSASAGTGRTIAAAPVESPGFGSETYVDAFRLGSGYDASPGAIIDARDEDEVAGVVGAVRSFHPFQSPELSEPPLPEINIAVIGAEGVGKSTFVQRVLDLPHLPASQAAECRIPINGSIYLVRLLELPLEEIEIDDDSINWPDTIEDKMMPRVDGALALYDIQDKGSIEDLPEMLSAITKSALPTVLVSCKCDVPPSQRQVDPAEVEYKARRAIGNIATLQISRHDPENNKRGVFALLKAIINESPRDLSRSSSANRRRAQSTAMRPVSPRPSKPPGHGRASSEFTGIRFKDQRHARHDSSTGAYPPNHHLRVPHPGSVDPMPNQKSFLLEESPSENSVESPRSSSSDRRFMDDAIEGGVAQAPDNGATFDELVDRLLAQPTSKADTKFAAVFLALYRKFAAPSRLLEALVDRFDLLERDGTAQMLKTVDQLRYMAVLEQWVSWYPGDFAFPNTKRNMRTLVAKLAETRLFAVAAKEISAGLDNVQEDDDTHWAVCDENRDMWSDASRTSLLSQATTLIDDPSYIFEQDVSGSMHNEGFRSTVDLLAHLKHINHLLTDVVAAQRQAEALQTEPSTPLTKVQWRALMELNDDLIAKELTRIDWIMFLSIRPRDLVRHVSLSKDQVASYKDLTHVNRMINHFNNLAAWVANYVLLRDKPKHRAAMLEKFMRIARKLREMNNYNSLGAIIAGVKSSAIHRLAATRELIPAAVGRDWLKLEILMAPSRSHFAYRLAWDNSSDARIPYLPLHRRDLVTAAEGNRSFVVQRGDDGGAGDKELRINWKKFEIIGDVIVSLQRAQGLPYDKLGSGTSPEAELVRELVLDVKLTGDEEDLYERSLQCEPAAGSGATAKIMEFFKR